MTNKENVLRDFNRAVIYVESIIGHNDITDNVELENAGKYLFDSDFLGVFSSDELPEYMDSNKFIIVNTDPSYKKGTHWVGLMTDDKGVIYFYDTYRRPYNSLSEYWSDMNWSEILNNEPEQSLVSDNCGQLTLASMCVFSKYGSRSLEII